jgi:hypothetical protein
MSFPAYRNIDLATTPLKWGYYVPGLIQQHRPDIELIDIHLDLTKVGDQLGHLEITHPDTDYSGLPARIEHALKNNKKVGLLLEDEWVTERNDQFSDIINHYQDQSVYCLTQHDQKRIEKQYQGTHRLQSKILELPWVILNECLMYNNAKQHRVPTVVARGSRVYNNQNTFFTLTGRYEPFRKRLLEKLIDHGLDRHGLLTIQDTPYNNVAYDLGDQVSIEPRYPYGDQPIRSHAKMAAQFEQNNHWISCNTQNFLHIEQTYLHYPLAIIPETCPYDYFATEKSVWPILLGKLFLIFGSAGCMKYIQRFYDIDMSEHLDLEFDNIHPKTDQDLDHKLDLMLDRNRAFVLNAHQFHDQNYQRLQAARNTLGPNLYRFVQEQVARIQ